MPILFTEILHNPCHVLQALLTPPADNLRNRPHNRQLPGRMSHLTNCILLFGCCFVRVIDCSDCIHFLLFIVLYFIGVCMSVYNCCLTVVLWKRHLILINCVTNEGNTSNRQSLLLSRPETYVRKTDKMPLDIMSPRIYAPGQNAPKGYASGHNALRARRTACCRGHHKVHLLVINISPSCRDIIISCYQ